MNRNLIMETGEKIRFVIAKCEREDIMAEKINLNNADFDKISHLPMVGDTRAKDIIDHRPYKDWNDLRTKVPGISEGMVNDLKEGDATIE